MVSDFYGHLAVLRRGWLLILLSCLLNTTHAATDYVSNSPSTYSSRAKIPATSSLTTLSSVSKHASRIFTASNAHKTSVSLSAALSVASTASAQQTQKAFIPPIPLPRNNTKYKELIALAKGLPPLQRTSEPIKAGSGAAANNGTGLRGRSADELQAMIDVLHPPRLNSVANNLTARDGSLRVLIVGDSMSEGQQGDWTWRYRIWQWFTQTNSIPVTFVGPWTGTVSPAAPAPPQPPPLYGSTTPPSPGSFDGGYAIGVDPAWANAGHFSAWGRAAATDQFLIQDIVEDYTPDLMLLMLGFNDLGWFYSDPSGTLNSVYNIIENARVANPNIHVAVANIPQRSSLNRQDLPANTQLYNSLLAQAVPYWTTPSSPIGLVQLQENYDCNVDACPAGYDGLHPNELGEYQIAQAFSQTLHSVFGYGNGPIVIPSNIPARPLPAPSNFQVFTSPQGVTATWDPVYGAYGYEVMSSIPGTTPFTSGTVPSNRYDQHWPLPNTTYALYVRAIAGDRTGPWTGTESAVAEPQTAPAPSNIVVNPTDIGITVTWDPPTGPWTDTITLYNVIIWDLDISCDFIIGNAFTSSPAVITDLNVGHRYLVAVETWNANGEGFPEVVNNAVPGYGLPAVPSGLTIVSQDPTSVYITWNAVPNAGGYIMYTRDNYTNGSFVASSPVNEPCWTDYFLFPGTWHFQFCVAAFNGNLLTYVDPWPCEYAPSPTSTMNPEPTCPGPAPWCAAGSAPWGPAPENPSNVGTLPGTGGNDAGNVVTITTTINGQPTTIVESIFTVVTTNADGQIATEVIVELPTPTGNTAAEASVITLTNVGADGTTTLLLETVYYVQTTLSNGATLDYYSTQSGVFPSSTRGYAATVTTTNAAGQPSTYTETIIPTTATYDGTTYTGTITEAPTTTTSGAPAGLTTITNFNYNTVSWSTTSVQSNTYDSSGHPILGPWPICWFCPPGSHGFVLFGFHFPGIYLPGGPPPDWPDNIPFPTLTIPSDGEPTYPSSPDPTNPSQRPSTNSNSQSTSSCTTTTVTDCFVDCNTNNAQSTTSCETSCSLISGCSATATTTTTTGICTGSYSTISAFATAIFPVSYSGAYSGTGAGPTPSSTGGGGTRPSTTTPPSNPSSSSGGSYTGEPTPVTSQSNQWAINLYSDSNCSPGNFLKGYYEHSVEYNCIAVPQGVSSWQFVSADPNCGNENSNSCFPEAALYGGGDSQCLAQGSDIVSNGCGADLGCQNQCNGLCPIVALGGLYSQGCLAKDQSANPPSEKRNLDKSGNNITTSAQKRYAENLGNKAVLSEPILFRRQSQDTRPKCGPINGDNPCTINACVPSKRDLLSSYASQASSNSSYSFGGLGKRTLGSCTQITNYIGEKQLLDQSNNNEPLDPSFQWLEPKQKNGDDLTYFTPTNFGAYPFSLGMGSVNYGTEAAPDYGFYLLTGCTVIAIISDKSVYMGHAWETFAFNNAPEANDPPGTVRIPADLQRNLLNLISGAGPRNTDASGSKLDPNKFKTGNPTAYIFTKGPPPLEDEEGYQDWTPSTNIADAFYPDQIGQIQDTIRGLIPNVKFNMIFYRTTGEGDSPKEPLPYNTAFFEYDPEGDGQPNSNPQDTTLSRWRLFLGGMVYTERMQQGR